MKFKPKQILIQLKIIYNLNLDIYKNKKSVFVTECLCKLQKYMLK